MIAADKPFDVFISHSTQDARAASAIKQHLHASGLRCWKAPDDIHPGESWPSAITRALSICRAMVLVWSRNSLASKEVAKELTLAMRNGLTVIPFRIEDVEPTAEWDYHLANTHWMDAFPGDLASYVEELAARIRALLDSENGPAGVSPGKPALQSKPASKRSRLAVAAAVIVAAAGTLSGALWFFSNREPEPVAMAAEPEAVTATTAEMEALRERAEQAEKEKAEALREAAEKEKESLRQAAQRAEAEKQLALERAAQAEAAAQESEQLARVDAAPTVDIRRASAGYERPVAQQQPIRQPVFSAPPASDGIWLFADSSSRVLQDYELRQLSEDQLWRARNEIYARRGYIFQSDRGQKFARTLGSAYRPVFADENAVISAMNQIERSNIELIKSFETDAAR